MKPILFKTEMVNAILNGHKTMTRRIMNPQPILCTGQKLKKNQGLPAHFNVCSRIKTKDLTDHIIPKPFQVGEILWVKETFSNLYDLEDMAHSYVYKASQDGIGWGETDDWKWTPSLFMPKDAARIFLEVTFVLYEQVQEISEEDAIKEGFKSREDFKNLWIQINGEKSWNDNPYVFVYTFEIKEIKYNDYETLQSNP